MLVAFCFHGLPGLWYNISVQVKYKEMLLWKISSSPGTRTRIRTLSALPELYLDQGQLGEKVTACRAGNVNPETRFVLDYWKVDAPALVEKVEEGQKIILVDHNEMRARLWTGWTRRIWWKSSTITGWAASSLPTRCLSGCSRWLHCHHPVQCGCGKQPDPAQRNRRAAVLRHQLRHPVLQVPTTTEKDKEAAGALAKIAGIADPQAYALEMLQAGSAINSMTAEEICHGDMKEFDFPQGKVTVAQVNVMNGEAAKAKWPELQKAFRPWWMAGKPTPAC